MTTPTSIEWSKLPARLAQNWPIYCAVTSAARIKFANEVAATTGQHIDSDEYHAAFVAASRDWLAANPDHAWVGELWKAGQAKYPGHEAVTEACQLLGI